MGGAVEPAPSIAVRRRIGEAAHRPSQRRNPPSLGDPTAGTNRDLRLALLRLKPDIVRGELAADGSLANPVRSGRKQP
jgi:hypothetical protein